jgi:hypothetical protein
LGERSRSHSSRPHRSAAGPQKRARRGFLRRYIDRDRLLGQCGQPRGDGVESTTDARRVINGVIDVNRPATGAANLLTIDQHSRNARRERERLQPVVLFDAERAIAFSLIISSMLAIVDSVAVKLGVLFDD